MEARESTLESEDAALWAKHAAGKSERSGGDSDTEAALRVGESAVEARLKALQGREGQRRADGHGRMQCSWTR